MTISHKADIRLLAALLTAALVCVPGEAAGEDYEYGVFRHWGIEVGAGSEGITAGVGATLTPFFEAGMTVNFMPAVTISGNMKLVSSTYSADGTTAKLPTVKVSGDLKRLTYNAKVSVYPFGPGTTFFVAGGVSMGGGRLAKLTGHSDEMRMLFDEYGDQLGEVGAIIGEKTLSMARNGDVEGEIRVNSVRPYIGVGVGRMVAKKYAGIRLEAGVQFTGKLKLYQDGTEIEYEEILKTAIKESTGDDRLSKLVDRMTIYPVLRLTFTGRLL